MAEEPHSAQVASEEPTDPAPSSGEAVVDHEAPQEAVEPALDGASGGFSFSEHMWSKFDFLWQNRSEPSQRFMEQVTAVLRGRAQLERQYGNSLAVLPDEVQLEPEGSTLHEAVESVMVNFRNRGEQCMQLAESIDNDIVLTLEEVMKQHKEISKRIFNDSQRLANYCRDTRQAHNKLARQYHDTCYHAEVYGQEVMSNCAMKSMDRCRFGQKSVELSKKAKVLHKDYVSSIEQANRAQMLYEQHMPLILTAMQDMETKRAKCLRDCLMKLAVYETSWLRNLQYDIDATVKAAEVSDPAKDLQEYIRKHQAEEAAQKAPPFSVRPFWELGKPRASPVTEQHKKQRMENDREIKAHSDGLQPMLSGFIDPDSPADFVKRWEPGVAQLKSNLIDLRARAAFLQVIAKLIVMRQVPQAADAPAPPLEDCLPVRITAACFEVIVALFLEVCSLCDSENDCWSGRFVMVLVNLLNCEAEGGRTVTLLTRVYNHPIWNKVAFWQDTLLVGIYEAYSAEAVWRRHQSVDMAQSLAVQTPFLAKFVWFMSLFGIRGDQARKCIREALQKQAISLGHHALEQHIRQLVHQVDAAEAQAACSAQAQPAGANSQAGGFAPPHRELENAVVADGASAALPEALQSGYNGAQSTLDGSPMASSAANAEDDFAAVALGVQDGFGDQNLDQEDAEVPVSVGSSYEQSEDPKPSSPGAKEPADTLRKLGVDQPSSSDVFG